MQSKLLSILSFAAAVHAHGRVISPAPRVAGSAFAAACGQQMLNTESSDPNGNIQGLAQQNRALDPSTCKLELCKGIPFEDNSDNVQSFTPGQTIDFQVQIAAPHTGVANVSVVDTASNSIIGTPLIEFENYASTKTGVAANNTAFSVTLPDSLPAKCATAGACVLQWWWDSPTEAQQTYMSCVDFTSGSGSGGSSPAPSPTTPTPTPSTSAAPSTTPSSAPPAATSAAPPAATSTPPTAEEGSTLPTNFTINEFITWLQATAGSDVAAKFRRHARQFMV